MNVKIITILSAIIIVTGAIAWAGTVDLDLTHSGKAAGLCQTGEKLIFGCDTDKGKELSLCRSQVLNKHTGWLKYRYGTGAANIETEYPTEKTKPHKLFTFEKVSRFQMEKVYVRFKNGALAYELFQEDYVTQGNHIVKNGVRINGGSEELCVGKPKGTLRTMEGDIPYIK